MSFAHQLSMPLYNKVNLFKQINRKSHKNN